MGGGNAEQSLKKIYIVSKHCFVAEVGVETKWRNVWTSLDFSNRSLKFVLTSEHGVLRRTKVSSSAGAIQTTQDTTLIHRHPSQVGSRPWLNFESAPTDYFDGFVLMDDLPHLFEDLMAFVAVVDAGGFNAAGERFGRSPSSLSRSVAALEKHLGVSLIVRTSRRFEVTAAGRRTYEDAVATRLRLQETIAVARESQGAPSGFLRVSCPMALASTVVGQIAIAFMARHRAVSVALEATDGRRQPFSEPADLAIQPSLQPLRDSNMVARRLCEVRYVLVAAPQLQHGIPSMPTGSADFPTFPAIGWAFFPNPSCWSLQHHAYGNHEIAVDARLTTENLLLVREAALGGVGVALLPYDMCKRDLERGALTLVAPEWVPPKVGIYVLYPSRRSLTLAGRKFIDALAQGMAPLDEAPI